MAYFFLKIDETFTLKESDDDKSLLKYKPKDDYDIEITIRSQKESDVNLSFEIGNKNSDGGQLTHQQNGNLLEISCKGVFKVNVKDQYEKDVLDETALCLFSAFGNYGQGLTRLEINDGLEAEEYEFRRRGETVKDFRYPIKIKTNSVKKKLE